MKKHYMDIYPRLVIYKKLAIIPDFYQPEIPEFTIKEYQSLNRLL